jgi:uncharacterized protein with GYD domain
VGKGDDGHRAKPGLGNLPHFVADSRPACGLTHQGYGPKPTKDGRAVKSYLEGVDDAEVLVSGFVHLGRSQRAPEGWRHEAARRGAAGVAERRGKVEAFYFTFGKNDVLAIVEAPDNVSIAAVSLAIAAGGGFRGQTTVILTPEEADQAVKKAVKYSAPGQ